MKINSEDISNMINEELVKNKLSTPLLESSKITSLASHYHVIKIINNSNDIQHGLKTKAITLNEAIKMASIRYANMVHDDLLETVLSESFEKKIEESLQIENG